ncbi:glycosyltransferase family 4 protein [Empedobacter falsenii]|uniref:glycosyltransferase family 4 protein n=1 Tax=Empedobacter falsenii TaxID=343874 RepID=UPI003A80EB36
MKNILYLTFYYEPDLCAGSFRNTPLIKELSKQCDEDTTITVITTMPNRYGSFQVEAPEKEVRGNLTIHRIPLPAHQSGMKDQIFSFKAYYLKALSIAKNYQYDLVVASSSRLFTAYLGYKLAHQKQKPLYLDIRDIFYDTMEDVLNNAFIKATALPIIKQIEKRTFSYASHINLISAGFKDYFKKYQQANYTTFTNGIDDIFIQNNSLNHTRTRSKYQIVYAGNIGEGQGLHKIIPSFAKQLENQIEFLIIGDGGAKQKLLNEIKNLQVHNISFHPPVKRDELIKIYEQCDFTFVHLNDYDAFKKVLPSKIFELACFAQPMIAGVGGYAYSFVEENVDNAILFSPCNVEELIEKFKSYIYKKERRDLFISKFKRDSINKSLAKSILSYL